MDAVDLLIEQHRRLEAQFKALPSAATMESKQAWLADVGDHLGVHLASEEEVFYPAVTAKWTEDTLLESLEEHLSLKRLLADLLALDPDEETFDPKCKVLCEQAVHHHKEEEEHLFGKVRAMMTDDERFNLGTAMLALQQKMKREGAPREVVAEQTDEAAKLQGR
jgi:hemerythrin superfamily protein